MESLIFFALGALISLVLTRAPIKIEVHHKHENIIPTVPEQNMQELEEKMLKDDPELDKLYKELDRITDVMGGSDR